MNKKEAIAYAQIALNYLNNPDVKKEVNLQNLGIEMNCAFRIYSRDVALIMARSMVETENEFDGK